MFQVLAPVVVAPTAEARQALGAELKEAGLAAWREIARGGRGLEMAHLQLTHAGVTLAVCSRLRRDGFVVIELGLGDPRQAGRSITMAELRRAETRAHGPRRRR